MPPTPPLGNFHIKTFGCQMNAYDSVRMAGLLSHALGGHQVEDPALADLIILNTCHIREKAEEKLFSELGRLRKLTAGRKVLFAVGGCVGQAEGEGIFRRAPFVNLVFGPQNYHRLPEMLAQVINGEGHLHDDALPVEPKFDALPAVTPGGSAASVTVQEGCDRFCTYCVVPFTRGREWSRPVAEILAEVAGLTAQGVREILLLGQNVNAYQGHDAAGVLHDLPLLIRQVALLPGVERIRFATSHPADMSQDLVEAFAEVESLCPYLHLPIQSGSNAILAAMERGHTREEYLSWLDRLRRARPGIALSTDFIVGFPGETEEDFKQTMDIAEEVRFDQAYSFKFSPRPGTPAALLEGQIPDSESTRRLALLQERLNAIQLAGNLAQVGKVEAVLAEGFSKQGAQELTGRTAGMRKVNFPGDPAWIGRILQVRILEGRPNSLKGQVVTGIEHQ